MSLEQVTPPWASDALLASAETSSPCSSPNCPEERWLEFFVQQFSLAYNFSTDQHFERLFLMLLKNRFMNRDWWSSASPSHHGRILQTLRVLTRDPSFQALAIDSGAVEFLCLELSTCASAWFNGANQAHNLQALIEISSTIKRFAASSDPHSPAHFLNRHQPAPALPHASSPGQRSQLELFSRNAHITLVQLLSCSDPSVSQAVLLALLYLSDCPLFLEKMPQLALAETLLGFFVEPGLDTQRRILAAEVLEHLLSSLTVRQDIARAGGVRSLLYLLGGKAEELTLMALRCLSKLCASNTDSKPKHGQIAEASSDLRLLGGIPVLLSRINRENGPVMSSIAIAVCTLLATLAFDDECSFEIRQKNGVYLLGDLIIQATPGDDANSESISEAKQLQLYAFRALRLLFCVERNRKVFKRLFSPDLFALFIDVGHYVMKLDSYLPLVAVFNSTSPASRASTIAAFDDLKTAKESDRRVIGGYVVEEVLGKGAFGTVYQVRAVNGEKAYAMKQLPLKDSALQLLNANLNGAAPQTPQQQQQQLQQSIGEICKEVEIISKLEHPNIVSYYTSFVEGTDLFIVMELIEGASLADHLSSLQEKGQEFQSEEKVWPVFIQLCLALSYLHLEKRVVHRDLTPNNVMLDRQNHVKITDFGLARQRQSSQALLQSAVGTISYSCPEIVQHQPYTDKADIWSLGCLLYQMASLRPPFSASNPLTVAQRIVEGVYEPLPSDKFSPLLRQVIKRMLSTKPEQRPDIVQVSQMIAPLLMTELDRVTVSQSKLQRSLADEKESRRRAVQEAAQLKLQLQQAQQQCRLLEQRHSRRGSDTGALNSIAAEIYDPEISAPPAVKRVGSSSTPTANSATITVASNRVHSVRDPAELLLQQLHKLVFVSNLPPLVDRSSKSRHRAAVQRYHKLIFGPSGLNSSDVILSETGSRHLKEELKKLSSSSAETIDFEARSSGLMSAFNEMANASLTISLVGNETATPRVTYEALHRYIEEALSDTSYYKVFKHHHIAHQPSQEHSTPSRSKPNQLQSDTHDIAHPTTRADTHDAGHQHLTDELAANEANFDHDARRQLSPDRHVNVSGVSYSVAQSKPSNLASAHRVRLSSASQMSPFGARSSQTDSPARSVSKLGRKKESDATRVANVAASLLINADGVLGVRKPTELAVDAALAVPVTSATGRAMLSFTHSASPAPLSMAEPAQTEESAVTPPTEAPMSPTRVYSHLVAQSLENATVNAMASLVAPRSTSTTRTRSPSPPRASPPRESRLQQIDPKLLAKVTTAAKSLNQAPAPPMTSSNHSTPVRRGSASARTPSSATPVQASITMSPALSVISLSSSESTQGSPISPSSSRTPVRERSARRSLRAPRVSVQSVFEDQGQ